MPTNKVARYSGGLSVFDFVKILTYQKALPPKSQEITAIASSLAQTEGLCAHKLACDVRLNVQK